MRRVLLWLSPPYERQRPLVLRLLQWVGMTLVLLGAGRDVVNAVQGSPRVGSNPLVTVGLASMFVGASASLLYHLISRQREERRRMRAAAGLCPACGYDLRASIGRCPECGDLAGHPELLG